MSDKEENQNKTETSLQRAPAIQAETLEKLLIGGDLTRLTPEQKIQYYKSVCDSVGLNPLTKPFEYIVLNNKLTLYATKGATDQLRNVYKISVNVTSREMIKDVYVVTARAKTQDGREDESTGAVSAGNKTGEALANLMMKAETKAKRRVTLSICGLGLLDESEVDSIPNAQKVDVPKFTPLEPIPSAPSSDQFHQELDAEEINPDAIIPKSMALDLFKRVSKAVGGSTPLVVNFLNDNIGVHTTQILRYRDLPALEEALNRING